MAYDEHTRGAEKAHFEAGLQPKSSKVTTFCQGEVGK